MENPVPKAFKSSNSNSIRSTMSRTNIQTMRYPAALNTNQADGMIEIQSSFRNEISTRIFPIFYSKRANCFNEVLHETEINIHGDCVWIEFFSARYLIKFLYRDSNQCHQHVWCTLCCTALKIEIASSFSTVAAFHRILFVLVESYTNWIIQWQFIEFSANETV